MSRYITVAVMLAFVGYREFGDKIALPVTPAVERTLADECCENFAKRIKSFYREGAKKIEAGEFATAKDIEAWATTNWRECDQKAFKPIDDLEANATFAKDWREAFRQQWSEWGGGE